MKTEDGEIESRVDEEGEWGKNEGMRENAGWRDKDQSRWGREKTMGKE